MKRTASLILKLNGSKNHPLPSKRPKVLHKPYSSISSPDKDSVQSRQHGISRPGTTPGRSISVQGSSWTPGFSFGSGRKGDCEEISNEAQSGKQEEEETLKPDR